MQEQHSSFILANVIKNYKLDPVVLAGVLFAGNKNAYMALRRVLRGEGRLYVNQLEKLAEYLGVSVSALYMAGCDTWNDLSTSQDSLYIKRGVYAAEYVFGTHRLIVTDTASNEVIFDKVLLQIMVVENLINTINRIINGTYSN